MPAAAGDELAELSRPLLTAAAAGTGCGDEGDAGLVVVAAAAAVHDSA